MSIVVTTYVPEGIVLAADSRLTLFWTSEVDGKPNQNASQISDTTDKIFILNERIGLATWADASINGRPIAGFVHDFIEQKISSDVEVDQVGQLLVDFFGQLSQDLNTFFYVVGYKKEGLASVQHIYHVSTKTKAVTRQNLNAEGTHTGANWGGEVEVISRLFGSVKLPNGGDWVELGETPVAWNFLTLQDAIDFSVFAVKTTVEAFRFQQRIKTVGGPVDVLVLRPNQKCEWISKKKLHE